MQGLDPVASDEVFAERQACPVQPGFGVFPAESRLLSQFLV